MDEPLYTSELPFIVKVVAEFPLAQLKAPFLMAQLPLELFKVTPPEVVERVKVAQVPEVNQLPLEMRQPL